MSEYQHKNLKIDKVFKNLIPPLSFDEYKQLEENLINEGCRDPICIWNSTIIDGHNRYEICLRHEIPFNVQRIKLQTKDEAIAWICVNQIGRRNITEETRRYLIGKRYEIEKSMNTTNYLEKNRCFIGKEFAPQFGAQTTSKSKAKRTSQKIGDEYHLAHSTVERCGAYSRAIDTLTQKSEELTPKILSGQTKISCENVIELSRLPAQDVKRLSKQLIENDRNFSGYTIARKNLDNNTVASKSNIRVKPELTVKNMPVFDPDAEISSLTLTMPSWISLIDRTGSTMKLDLVSYEAKTKLLTTISELKESIDTIIRIVKE